MQEIAVACGWRYPLLPDGGEAFHALLLGEAESCCVGPRGGRGQGLGGDHSLNGVCRPSVQELDLLSTNPLVFLRGRSCPAFWVPLTPATHSVTEEGTLAGLPESWWEVMQMQGMAPPHAQGILWSGICMDIIIWG